MILIPLAKGFEEIEAVTCINVLRRAGIQVAVASVEEDLQVLGSRNIIVMADTNIGQINAEELEGIVLPGGMPGATNLQDSAQVIEITQKLAKKGKLVAAICAAPIVLERAGVINSKKATSYPGFEQEMGSCTYHEQDVVVDGNIITARGPGIAMAFAIELIKYLKGTESADSLIKGMLIRNN